MNSNPILQHLILLGISFGFFLFAYLFHLIAFFSLRRFFVEGGLGRSIIDRLAYPTRFFFFLIAALCTLQILPFPERGKLTLFHLLFILLIATVGWTLIHMAKGVVSYLRSKYETEAFEEFEKRSIVTRTEIFYRAIVFLIILLTAASILMTFPSIKSLGIGLLGSAGIAGIALGIAARPILTNLMAGFQIAFTKMLKIGDQVQIDGEGAVVENMFLTHVILKTSDLRRIIMPISYFIDKPFQNLSSYSTEVVGTIFLYCDYTAPVELLRSKLFEILRTSPEWTQKQWSLDVTGLKEEEMELRCTMSARNPTESFALSCYVREKMIDFLHREHPHALPIQRIRDFSK